MIERQKSACQAEKPTCANIAHLTTYRLTPRSGPTYVHRRTPCVEVRTLVKGRRAKSEQLATLTTLDSSKPDSATPDSSTQRPDPNESPIHASTKPAPRFAL